MCVEFRRECVIALGCCVAAVGCCAVRVCRVAVGDAEASSSPFAGVCYDSPWNSRHRASSAPHTSSTCALVQIITYAWVPFEVLPPLVSPGHPCTCRACQLGSAAGSTPLIFLFASAAAAHSPSITPEPPHCSRAAAGASVQRLQLLRCRLASHGRCCCCPLLLPLLRLLLWLLSVHTCGSAHHQQRSAAGRPHSAALHPLPTCALACAHMHTCTGHAATLL